MILRLAARNLLRNLRRTVITVAAIGLSVGLILSVGNIQSWQHQDMITKAIAQLAGDAVVQPVDYRNNPSSDRVVAGASDVAETMSELYPDATVTRRVQVSGVMSSATNFVGIGLRGIDPIAEAQITDFDDKLVDGEWLNGNDRGILLGVRLAEKLDVSLGSKVVVMSQTDADMVSRLFRVSGIFRTGSDELDGFVALTTVDGVQELYEAEDVATQVALHLDNHDEAEAAATAIAERVSLDGVETLPWRDAIPDIVHLIKMDRVSADVMWAIMGLMVAAGVLNTVLMSVLERVREFGVLLAVGMKPRRLAGMILAEGFLLGLAGAALGAIVGALFTWPVSVYGFDLSGSYGDAMDANGVTVDTVFYATWDPEKAALYLSATVLFTLLATAWPAWRVTRMKPVEAMRHT